MKSEHRLVVLQKKAKEYLESHLQFEYCNDKTFRDLQVDLIDQFY